nr:MAG TPA: hypothetical protein [Caudoviricetes sp.]
MVIVPEHATGRDNEGTTKDKKEKRPHGKIRMDAKNLKNIAKGIYIWCHM